MEQQKIINKFYDEVMLYGDELFERDAKIVEQVCNINMKKIIPVLIDMLNTLETGKHQPCTIYAVILNICKKNKTAISFIQDAIIKKTAPKYYLEELITKLTKYSIKNKI